MTIMISSLSFLRQALNNNIFLFHYYVHYSLIMIISLLRRLQAPIARKRFVFPFCCYFPCTIIKRKTFFFILLLRILQHNQEKNSFFLFQHYVHYVIATEKRNLIFIAPLIWLSWSKYSCVSFQYNVHYANISLHFFTTLTSSLTCRENILPRNIKIALKTFRIHTTNFD